MSGLDELKGVIDTDEYRRGDGLDFYRGPQGFVRSIVGPKGDVPEDVARPILATTVFVSSRSLVRSDPGLSTFQVLGEDGETTPYYLVEGDAPGDYVAVSRDTILETINSYPRELGANEVFLTDEPLGFEELTRLPEELGVRVEGLGADGLFDASPEVQSDIIVPEMPAPPEPLGLVENFTRQASPLSSGEPSFVVRQGGDVVATNENRLAPEMPDPPVLEGEEVEDSIISRRGTLRELDEGVQLAGKPGVLSNGGDVPTMEEAFPDNASSSSFYDSDELIAEPEIVPHIEPPGVVDGHPPYDEQEDIGIWLRREHDVIMPDGGDESQLSMALSMVAAQIVDGNIAPNAREAILEVFAEYDEGYSGYLENLFDNAVGLGHDALSERDYALNVLQSERANSAPVLENAAPSDDLGGVMKSYDGAEPIEAWLSREYGVDTSVFDGGDSASEDALFASVSTIANGIEGGEIPAEAYGPIMELMAGIEDPVLGLNRYGVYLDFVMAEGIENANGLVTLDEIKDKRADHYDVQAAEQGAPAIQVDDAPDFLNIGGR